jgi:hypothetical protein
MLTRTKAFIKYAKENDREKRERERERERESERESKILVKSLKPRKKRKQRLITRNYCI